MVTSASDGFARVWSDKGELQSIFNCNTISKTNNPSHFRENVIYILNFKINRQLMSTPCLINMSLRGTKRSSHQRWSWYQNGIRMGS